MESDGVLVMPMEVDQIGSFDSEEKSFELQTPNNKPTPDGSEANNPFDTPRETPNGSRSATPVHEVKENSPDQDESSDVEMTIIIPPTQRKLRSQANTQKPRRKTTRKRRRNHSRKDRRNRTRETSPERPQA